MKKLAAVMGLLQEDANEYLAAKKAAMLADINISEEEIQDHIQKRNKAREAKDWARSDAIRDRLLEQGIELKDGPEGTGWTVKRS